MDALQESGYSLFLENGRCVFSAFVTLAFGLVEFRTCRKGLSFNKSTFLE